MSKIKQKIFNCILKLNIQHSDKTNGRYKALKNNPIEEKEKQIISHTAECYTRRIMKEKGICSLFVAKMYILREPTKEPI